jgi:alpha-D-ribose 1-methylphosphonate 5-triphosphate synthase subunit PhnI
MYATLHTSDRAVAAAQALAAKHAPVTGLGTSLPALEDRVCAESGTWAPDVARRAIEQAGGDLTRAVTLVRVWSATLPLTEGLVVDPDRIHVTRRLSGAYRDLPGGQWLGRAPELGSRLLTWDDDERVGPPDLESTPAAAAPTAGEHPEAPGDPGGAGHPDREQPLSTAEVPSRADLGLVGDLLRSLPLAPADPPADGPDPVTEPLAFPAGRAALLTALVRGETGALTALANAGLVRRREAVLVEVTAATVEVRVAHPRTGEACTVAEVPMAEAEVVLDAEVDGRAGLRLGWGATVGTIERRALAVALLDGLLEEARHGTPASLELDGPTVAGAVDGPATTGFVDHLCLPHHASFGSYLAQIASGSWD